MNAKPKPGLFVPKCNCDGSYAQVQCSGSTGYCWCSTKLGKKVPGTSVRGKLPKCKSAGLSKCQKQRRAASMVKKIGAFIPKCNRDGSYAQVQCHKSTGYCWCSTKCGTKLPGTSVRGKPPKCKSAGLSKCQKQRRAALRTKMIGAFVPKCDRDGSYSAVQCHASTGYCWCTKKDGNRVPGSTTRGVPPNCLLPLGFSKCQRQRRAALRTKMIGAFVPKCDRDGSYSAVQCHASTGYCWCSTEDGNRVP